MAKDKMIWVDLLKGVPKFHGTSMSGDVQFRKKVARPRLMNLKAVLGPAVVAIEAYGRANHAGLDWPLNGKGK